MDLEPRIAASAERHFQRSRQTEFPTVRQTARRLKTSIREVYDVVDSSSLMCLEYYDVEWKVKDGDWFIYVY